MIVTVVAAATVVVADGGGVATVVAAAEYLWMGLVPYQTRLNIVTPFATVVAFVVDCG